MEKNPKLKIADNLNHSQKHDDTLIFLLNEQLKDAFKSDFLELEKRGQKFTVPVEIVAEFYSGVLASLAGWFIQNKNNTSAAQMDEYLKQMINSDFFIGHDDNSH